MNKFLSQFILISLWCFIIVISGSLLVSAGAYLYLSPSLPSVEALRDIQLQTPLRIYSSDKKLIAEYGEKRRSPIKFEETPTPLVRAFLAAEDDRFYSHMGVDPVGLLRATAQLLSTGRIQSGGSTITMQVAKNFFLSHEKVFSRKFNEILLAIEIEQKLDKHTILELYLNKIYLGNRAYGVEAAAQVYYGKSVDELTLAEMAMIAGLPKAPSRYNPLANANRALVRRNWILSRMHDLGYISARRYQRAIAQPITAKYHGHLVELHAPYAAEMARQEAIEQFGDSAYTDGYEFYTTIDSTMQEAANKSIADGIFAYDERHGYRGVEKQLGPNNRAAWYEALSKTASVSSLEPAIVINMTEKSAELLMREDQKDTLEWEAVSWAKSYTNVNRTGALPKQMSDVFQVGDLIRVRKNKNGDWHLGQIPDVQAALVALEPANGSIKSIVGGFNFYDSNYNRAIQANRQVGSALKPFVYGAAIANGLTAATIINDAPLIFSDDELETEWRPQNSNERFYGPMRLREGLYRSRNLVSIRVLQRTGIAETKHYLTKLGIKSEKIPNDLSLALGSASLTPLEVAEGYAILANGGYRVDSYIVQEIKQGDEIIFRATPVTACRECVPNNLRSDRYTEKQAQESQPLQAPKVMDERVSYIINDILQDVIKKGTGRRAGVLKRSDLGGKTGTTNDQIDVWFSGYSSDLQATVWLGFDQPKPLGRWEYGANVALPIWIDFMKVALNGMPERSMPQPPGIVSMRINPETGRPARPGEKGAIFEIFRAEYAPKVSDLEEPVPSLDSDSLHSDVLF